MHEAVRGCELRRSSAGSRLISHLRYYLISSTWTSTLDLASLCLSAHLWKAAEDYCRTWVVTLHVWVIALLPSQHLVGRAAYSKD